MGKLKQQYNLSNLLTVDDLIRFLSQITDEYATVVNGQLQFDQNLKTSTVDVRFTAANTQVSVPHGLARVPTGYIQAKSNVAARIYDGGSTNTDSVLYLKSDAIANVKVIVF